MKVADVRKAISGMRDDAGVCVTHMSLEGPPLFAYSATRSIVTEGSDDQIPKELTDGEPFLMVVVVKDDLVPTKRGIHSAIRRVEKCRGHKRDMALYGLQKYVLGAIEHYFKVLEYPGILSLGGWSMEVLGVPSLPLLLRKTRRMLG